MLFSLDEALGDYYYFNFETGETQWSHPLDDIYREKVIQTRKSFSSKESILKEALKSNEKLIKVENNENLKEGLENTIVNVNVNNQQSCREQEIESNKQENSEMMSTPKKLVSSGSNRRSGISLIFILYNTSCLYYNIDYKLHLIGTPSTTGARSA